MDDEVHFCEQGNIEDGTAHFIWNPDRFSVEFLVSTEWRGKGWKDNSLTQLPFEDKKDL